MTAIAKNIYFDALDNIVNKYNNAVHRTIKMKLIEVTSDFHAEYNEDSNKTILNLKLVIIQEFLSTKISLLKDMLLIGQKISLLLVKLKIQSLYLKIMLLVI